jgi:putative flippase GtrA
MTRLILESARRFGVVGVVNTLAGLAVIFFAKAVLSFNDVAANVTGYAVGIGVSFVLNRRWTFVSDHALLPSFLKFIVVIGVAYAVNLLTVLWAIGIGVDDYAAQAMGIVPYALLGYAGSRWFAFAGNVPERRRSGGEGQVRHDGVAAGESRH